MTKNKTTLKSELNTIKENFESKVSKGVINTIYESNMSIKNSGILEKAKKLGDKAPNFVLYNALGNPIELKEYLYKGKVVLTWYRGGWCPYCNLTLRQLQQELANFKANGANLIALTPELPDKSMTTTEKNDLEFEVLSDVGNKIAKTYGIVFKMSDEMAQLHSFGLENYNGDDSHELPIAATYVINENREIIYAFLDADYKNRAEPSEITKILKAK